MHQRQRARWASTPPSPPTSAGRTNIGTFRAYVQDADQAHPACTRDMTLMVRMLSTHGRGRAAGAVLRFTATTAWVSIERIQGDIFDHLLPAARIRPAPVQSPHGLGHPGAAGCSKPAMK